MVTMLEMRVTPVCTYREKSNNIFRRGSLSGFSTCYSLADSLTLIQVSILVFASRLHSYWLTHNPYCNKRFLSSFTS